MAITVFQTNTETLLAQMAADLLAANATADDGTAQNENAQFLVVLWALVKFIKARQHAAPTTGSGFARDRVLELVGGITHAAMLRLVNDIDAVYNEMYVLFNSVDQNLTDDTDEIWGASLGTRGPVAGPIMGSPNYTAGHIV